MLTTNQPFAPAGATRPLVLPDTMASLVLAEILQSKAVSRLAYLVDSRRRREIAGARLVFEHLSMAGTFRRFSSPRILEVGPKHGEDSALLATLAPSELVLVDLPEKRDVIDAWLPALTEGIPARLVEANLLYLDHEEIAALGRFDIVWCLGVLYHNVEQLRLLRRLFMLLAPRGLVVVETSTTRNLLLTRRNVVELHWPCPYRGTQTVTHLPSRRAVASWLEMVGFEDVRVLPVYSWYTGWQRAVLTGERRDADRAYASYAQRHGDLWHAGDAR
jgi:2-polyprenyl-3-methyl-5-hydroxy-6-metoxy-1,4-benzoquinol methylase